jgi:hypothetical protein
LTIYMPSFPISFSACSSRKTLKPSDTLKLCYDDLISSLTPNSFLMFLTASAISSFVF